MSLISSILLGLVQGLAEFLPISSSGHLAIAAHFMGQAGIGEPPPFFDVLLHLGTLAAVFAPTSVSFLINVDKEDISMKFPSVYAIR